MSRKVTAKKLSPEAFQPFGTYFDIVNPTGYYLEGEYHRFYRDPVRFSSGQQEPVCFSSLVVKDNPQKIVKNMEYHDYTDEIQLPVAGDAILVCAPANGGDLMIDEVEAFIVPQGTIVCLRRGTWHDVMYPVNGEKISVLIGLPERVYHNDIVVKSFEEDTVQIEL